MKSVPPTLDDPSGTSVGRSRRTHGLGPLVAAIVASLVVVGALGAIWFAFSRAERSAPEATLITTSGSPFSYLKLGGARPTSIILAYDSVWVTARDGNQAMIFRIDPTNARVIASIPLRAGPIWETGGGGMASGDGAIWVTGDDGLLQRIDAKSNRLTQVISLGAKAGGDIAVDSSGVWVSIFATDDAIAVVRVDPSTGHIVSKVPLEGAWIREVFSADGFIFVRTRIAQDDTVTDTVISVIDPSTNQVVSTARNSEVEEPFAQASNVVWGAAGQKLFSFSVVDGTLKLAEIPVADQIAEASMVPSADSIWFVARGILPVRAKELSLSTGRTIRELALPITPVAMAVAQGSLWAFGYDSESILIARIGE